MAKPLQLKFPTKDQGFDMLLYILFRYYSPTPIKATISFDGFQSKYENVSNIKIR